MNITLKESIGFLIEFHSIAGSLSGIQLAILLEVFRSDKKYTANEIAEELGLTVGQVRRTVIKLTTKSKRHNPSKELGDMSGWVTYDRRLLCLRDNYTLHLTRRGESVCKAVIACGKRHFPKKKKRRSEDPPCIENSTC